MKRSASISRFLLTLFLALWPMAAVQAFGVSPAYVDVDPLIAGKSKTITVSVTRSKADYTSRATGTISDELKGYITIVNADAMTFHTGERGIPVKIIVNAKYLKPGDIKKGIILFNEIRDDAVLASTGNLPGVAMDFRLVVSDDETRLLTVDNISTASLDDGKRMSFQFLQRNDRYNPGAIKTARFSFEKVDDPSELIVREISLPDPLLAPGEYRSETGFIDAGVELIGDYALSVEYFDEKGKSITTQDAGGTSFNQKILDRQNKTLRYIFFLVSALAIAGLFVADYIYLKKKRRG